MRYNSPRFGRKPAARWSWLMLAGAGLLAGWALMTVLALPQLTDVWPAPGARNIASRAPLRLTFNRLMQIASVESALAIEPPLTGTFRADGYQIIFTPAQPWPAQTLITLTLSGGRSASGLPLLGQRQWTFTAAGQRLAYLVGGVPNLHFIGLDESAEIETLTAEPYGVYNYDLSRDGLRVAYAALREDGGADIRLLTLGEGEPRTLLTCPGAACLSPTFSPDGAQLAYEWQTLITTTDRPTFGESRVHLHTLATGADETQPALGDARFPRWNPDGRLSYYDTERRAVVVREVQHGALTYIPNDSGDMGSWSPDGAGLVFPEVAGAAEAAALPGEDFVDHFYSRLVRVEVATNQTRALSGEALVTDASPVFSPSGAWIAFGRRQLTPALWTLGRQLWLMRADGGEAHALTNAPTHNHSAFVWSADEATVFYMRYNAGDPVAPVEIWSIQRDGSNAHAIVTGYLPRWVP